MLWRPGAGAMQPSVAGPLTCLTWPVSVSLAQGSVSGSLPDSRIFTVVSHLTTGATWSSCEGGYSQEHPCEQKLIHPHNNINFKIFQHQFVS